MSCTIVALPFALAPLVLSVAGAAASALTSQNDKYNDVLENTEFISESDLVNRTSVCDNENVIMFNDTTEQSFETQIMDKEILLKTLEEHGVKDIEESYNGDLTGRVEGYSLKFEKPSADKPYNLIISCNKGANAEEKAEDIKSEYTMNVQESAYLSIIEKLKENNMQIEDETVEDDNTIVLTINLE